ncbi:unnamed protein product, partial [Acidithrix sp. C25]
VSFITNNLLTLSGWTAIALIFLLPALESSVFLGFIVPGETAVLVGGVLAYEHHISLWAALLASVMGAIIGDSIGYFVGRKFGRRILASKYGRFVKARHIKLAEDFIARRGGLSIFIGRYAATLRAIVPGLAGMTGMRYKTFAIFNVLGGATWAILFSLAGYLAGASFHRVQSISGIAGYVLMALILVILVVAYLLKRRVGRKMLGAEAIFVGRPDDGEERSSEAE